MHHSADLIVDVGMCDGTDTAYYLSKGYRVVAVEADPILCDKASQRFAREIAEDKLTILNVGIAQSDEVMTFYRNVADPGGSTFNATLCNPDIVYEEVKVHCLPLSSVIKKYGVPYYLKIDIEGFDEIAVSSLTSSLAPKYISVELNFCDSILPLLRDLGYRQFKLINQTFHTTSLAIGNDEWAWRALRKISRTIPVVKKCVQLLPQPLRPRTEWDVPYRPDGRPLDQRIGSGPFGEQTHGVWRDYEAVKRTYDMVISRNVYTWWDIHARQ